jgi:1,2-diacylglycerol 3-alpha-glucosyltransferase
VSAIPRVAIACSGLGHVRRGNETWARTLAGALHEAGHEVSLFGGGADPLTGAEYKRIPNLRRNLPPLRRLAGWGPRYLLEQRTFGWGLLRHLRRERFDVVHVADPQLALFLRRRLAPGEPRVFYKDGLLLGPQWCSHFEAVQVLAPYYLEQARQEDVPTEGWHVIPHMVDARRFHPAEDAARARSASLDDGKEGRPFTVLAVGDLSPGSNKRLDWIVDEMARLRDLDARLVLLGQATPHELRRFREAAERRLGRERVEVVANVPPEEMPRWYRAADVFVHAALREPFGIVFLEAMASGLPVIAHAFPVTQWIVGEGGRTVDMTVPGQLADGLAEWARDPQARAAASGRALSRARTEFSPAGIVPLYVEAYRRVSAG